ncbi:MAG: AIR synthase-related protein [Candidatus Andersenbacteria bacterium]
MLSAYADSGVDIDAGELFVAMLKERIAAAWPEVGKEIGGFAGSVQFPALTNKVRCGADGSGTMAIVAALCDQYEVIGTAAAAMSLVDTYVGGALPVGLLDVIDVGKLVPEKHIRIIDGLIQGCKLAGSARLIGGETAELPDMFRHSWMVNVNTAAIGFPDPCLLTGNIRPGMTVWGWRSEGPASNGFSLIRRALQLKGRPSLARKRLTRYSPDLRGSLQEALLVPVPIWINQIEIQRSVGTRFAGHAHITGGGLVDNIPRILPESCKVVLDRSTWERSAIFPIIQREGNVSAEEMDRVFNQGLMVVSVLDSSGKEPTTPNILPIGTVEKRGEGERQVQFTGVFNN